MNRQDKGSAHEEGFQRPYGFALRVRSPLRRETLRRGLRTSRLRRETRRRALDSPDAPRGKPV